MEFKSLIVLLILGLTANPGSVSAVWTCSQDSECSSISGGVCSQGACVCPPGQQAVQSGTQCVDLAPYHTSVCREDHQCSRLSLQFQCRRDDSQDEGTCSCNSNHHYFLGRCWPSRDFGEACSTDAECLGVLRDPYSMSCGGVCGCAAGYVERQRGECRKVGLAVGDGCVLDSDCQFNGGACDTSTFSCYDSNIGLTSRTSLQNVTKMTSQPKMAARQHFAVCTAASACPAPFECSSFGVCLCPVGYYNNDDGASCLAELGSPSTLAQCAGLLAEVRDGVCTCPVNFYFEENMRDCVRATRVITESCVSDSNCHTFGSAARCGPPQAPWGVRSCECDPELAVWDAGRQLCRLFAGIGEACLVDSDCLAGELEIQCQLNAQGEGYCACPDGLIAVDGLCLTTGLALGDACQASLECTATPNTLCEAGVCSCDSSGYQELDGGCAPIIGGVCGANADCVIDNTECRNDDGVLTCQCQQQFVEYGDACWSGVLDQQSPCNVSAQCQQLLGEASACVDSSCQCDVGFHQRDGSCWPVTGLYESCSRSSQCYLGEYSERAVCRNSLCQCDFSFQYSEELNTCTSGSSKTVASILLLALSYVLALY